MAHQLTRHQGVVVPPDLAGLVNYMLAYAHDKLEHLNGDLPGGSDIAELREQLRVVARAARSAPAAKSASGPSSSTMSLRAAVSGWLTVSEASTEMGISPRSVRRLAHGGRIIAGRRGRDWQIDRLAAEDYGKRRRERERVEHRNR